MTYVFDWGDYPCPSRVDTIDAAFSHVLIQNRSFRDRDAHLRRPESPPRPPRFLVKRPRKKQPRRMQFETLEPRQVMAAGITASLTSGGVLNVIGTDSADQIQFKQVGKYLSINGVSGSWTETKVKSIFVDLKGGDDYVSLASLANGGNKALNEKITVKSGSGNEHVRLASLHNVYMSGTGHTLTVVGLDSHSRWRCPEPHEQNDRLFFVRCIEGHWHQRRRQPRLPTNKRQNLHFQCDWRVGCVQRQVDHRLPAGWQRLRFVRQSGQRWQSSAQQNDHRAIRRGQ